MITSLQGSIDDDARSARALMCELASIHSIKNERGWKLRCQDCTYLGPWAAAVLYAAFLEGRRLGSKPRIQLPDRPPPLRAFCTFSGMNQFFRNGDAPEEDHPDCETIPLERFSVASWDRSHRLIRLIRRHMDLDPDREDQIRTCVQEVTQNIVDHAASGIGGVLAARYIASSQEVRMGIVDRGVGITATLQRQFPDVRRASIAISRVIEGGYSSRSRPNNMGLGVSNLFRLVKSAGGAMALFTGDSYAEVHGSMEFPAIQSTGCEFPGTAVFFTLPVAA